MEDKKQKIEDENAEEEMRDLTDDELSKVTGGVSSYGSESQESDEFEDLEKLKA